MTLRKKTLGIIGLTIGILFVILSLTVRSVLLHSFKNLESKYALENLERVEAALTAEIDALSTSVHDWASWDEAYNFVQHPTQEWIDANATASNLQNLGLVFLVFINSSGEIVFGKALDSKGSLVPLSKDFLVLLEADNPLIDHRSTDSIVKGLLLLPEGPIIVGSRPILTSSNEGPIQGTLIMARRLDSHKIQALSERTHFPLTVYQINAPTLPPDFTKARTVLSEKEHEMILPLSEKAIAGYAKLQDIYSAPILLIKAEMPRDIYKQGKASIAYLLWSLLIIGLVFIAVSLLILEKTILARMASLSRRVSEIGVSGNVLDRIEFTGKDELGSLAENINGMLETLEKSRTTQSKMEEELFKSRKIESIGTLAGGLAHDFNNILAAILGNISMAKMITKPEEKVFKRLVDAERACRRAQDLTYQLLTFSKGGAPIKEVISLPELIQEAAGFATTGSKVKCRFFISPDLWPVTADQGQIIQVLNNLIINANQAMPDGGMMDIEAQNIIIEKTKEFSGLPLENGKYIKITIRDYGAGIPEQDLGKIFDPYFSTKQKGSGLGLTTSYSIVKKHQGHIAVESKINMGSSISVYLPAVSKPIPIASRESDENFYPGSGKILVMDDEISVRDTLGNMLDHIGYQADFAEDGEKAIKLYQEALDNGKPFDAVIIDLTIPGGMGGKETIQHLRNIDPSVKAIVSSGYYNDPVMAHFREYGFNGVVSKPYLVKKLSHVLHDVIIVNGK